MTMGEVDGLSITIPLTAMAENDESVFLTDLSDIQMSAPDNMEKKLDGNDCFAQRIQDQVWIMSSTDKPCRYQMDNNSI